MKPTLFTIILIYLVILSTYSLVILDENYILSLGGEDGPIETLGAVFFLIGSGLFLAAYFHSSYSWNPHAQRNMFYLLLAILLFICFGEEISWGQRVFNWETPELFEQLNAQGETNVHNIWLFYWKNPDGTIKSNMQMLLNMNRLFSIFWLLFCFIIPLLDKFSVRLRTLFMHISLPIAPLWIGFLFVTHAIVFQVIYNNSLGVSPHDVVGGIDELKETNYALIFAIFAFGELRKTYWAAPAPWPVKR